MALGVAPRERLSRLATGAVEDEWLRVEAGMPAAAMVGAPVRAEWTVTNVGPGALALSFYVAAAPARVGEVGAVGFAVLNVGTSYASASGWLEPGAQARVVALVEPVAVGPATLSAGAIGPRALDLSLRYAVAPAAVRPTPSGAMLAVS